jgi:VWFA-related protein
VSTEILEVSLPKILLALALSPLLCAQNTSTFSTDVRVVNLFASVHDDQGRPARNLTKDDFTLEEDGRPQTIRYFSRETGLPLTLGLLVDTSVSQRRVLAEERTASLRFLNQVLRPDQDRALVIHFDRDVELLQDLTASREQLEQALARLQSPKLPPRKRGAPKVGAWALSGTALYDSVLLASEDLLSKQSGRKALVILTDGVDNGSKIGLSRAIESAQRADALVYSILFSDRGAYDGVFASLAGKKALQRISHETGGGYFEVSDGQPISTIYAQLEEKLRDQYSIGYTPDRSAAGTDAGAGYRKIHLAAKRTGLLVETRDGYYALSKTLR